MAIKTVCMLCGSHAIVSNYSVLQNQELVNGRTGNVSFNGAGDRLNAVYEIVNIQSGGSVVVGNCAISNVSHVS